MSKRAAKSTSKGTPAKLPKSYDSLSNEALRERLITLGDAPGPIDDGNRSLYIRLLEKQESGKIKQKVKPVLVDSRNVKKNEDIQNFCAKGMFAATITPFQENGEINLSAISKYANILLKEGVPGVFVNGSSGEGMSLTSEERKKIVEEWIKAGKGKLKVIAHVGTENLKTTCELAMHAFEAGADGVAVVSPSYYKPQSLDALVLYLEAVSKCIPTCPLYYYHIDCFTGLNYKMEDFLDAVTGRIPNFRGMKFTGPDLVDFSRCMAKHGSKYQIMYSSESHMLGALSLGAKEAHVGAYFSFAAKLYNRLFTAFKNGDMASAQLEQQRTHSIMKIQSKYSASAGFVGFLKAVMKMKHGLDMGPPRLPYLPISISSIDMMEKDLKEIGFFRWS